MWIGRLLYTNILVIYILSTFSHGLVQLLSSIEGLGLKFFLCHMNSLVRDQVWELIEVERIKMQFCQISWL